MLVDSTFKLELFIPVLVLLEGPSDTEHFLSSDILGEPKIEDNEEEHEFDENNFAKKTSEEVPEEHEAHRDDFENGMHHESGTILYCSRFRGIVLL